MKAPFKLTISTDNTHLVKVSLEDAAGAKSAIDIPSSGNVYQGLHSVKDHLEQTINAVATGLWPFLGETEEEAPPESKPKASEVPTPEPAPRKRAPKKKA